MSLRIHIFGAPGAGVTTLGRAVAARLGCSCFDTDDYYWFTDDPLPYRRKRNPEHRLRLLTADLDREAAAFVVSGALLGWGEPLLERFDAVVYRRLPTPLRLARIRERETARYGRSGLLQAATCTVFLKNFCTGQRATTKRRRRNGAAGQPRRHGWNPAAGYRFCIWRRTCRWRPWWKSCATAYAGSGKLRVMERGFATTVY
ncbi:MAG: hypothetical protein IPM98_05235 [Lewinellaceae bacterium]|nr:hypothetical protein [Lewinellaceae bacterium]